MKILQISPAFFPAISIGGPIYSTLTFSEILSKNNDITTLTTQLGLKKDQINNLNFGKKIDFKKNHKLIYFKYFGYSNFTFCPSIFNWLRREVSSFDLAIFQGSFNFPFILTYIFCRKYKVPYYLFLHGNLYDNAINSKSKYFKKIFIKLYVEKLLKNSKSVIFTTKDEEYKVRRIFNFDFDSCIIPNIVKSEDFNTLPIRGYFRNRYNINNSTKLLLHFGRISKIKGIEYSLYALKYLINNNLDVKFIISGGDEDGYKSHLLTIIENLNLCNHVYFTGLLNREESKQILVDSDIFLLPSYSENFGISIVEAMLCGLPVIISNNVGIAKPIKENNSGIVFDFLRLPDSLNSLLLNVINDENLLTTLKVKGKKFAKENYDTNVVENIIIKNIHCD